MDMQKASGPLSERGLMNISHLKADELREIISIQQDFCLEKTQVETKFIAGSEFTTGVRVHNRGQSSQQGSEFTTGVRDDVPSQVFVVSQSGTVVHTQTTLIQDSRRS